MNKKISKRHAGFLTSTLIYPGLRFCDTDSQLTKDEIYFVSNECCILISPDLAAILYYNCKYLIMYYMSLYINQTIERLYEIFFFLNYLVVDEVASKQTAYQLKFFDCRPFPFKNIFAIVLIEFGSNVFIFEPYST